MAEPTRHTLMREDLSVVNARAYGATRDSTTIWSALSAIGAEVCTLMLLDEDDGIWTLSSDVTIPDNVTLSLPSGVTLQGTGNLTILGGVIALRQDWFQSTGTLIWNASAAPSVLGVVRTGQLILAQSPANAMRVQSAQASTDWTLTLPPNPGMADQALLTDGAGVTRWQTVQALDPLLTALAALTTTNNQTLYFTGPDAPALTTLAPYARTLLDDPDAPSMQATLALVPGTHVQPSDATLTAFAALTGAANTLSYFTGPDQFATTPFTPYARTLLDDANATAMQATLALGALAPLSSITTPFVTDKAITLAKVQDVAAGRLLGNSGGSPATVQEITVGAGLTFTGGVLNLNPSATAPGGVSAQAQWNSAGVFAGSSGLTLNATQVVSIVYADQAAGRLALGLDTMALQNAGAVSITGGNATLTTVAAQSLSSATTASLADMYTPDRGGTLVLGWNANISAGAGQRYNLYAQGSAPNFMGGQLGLAGAPLAGAELTVYYSGQHGIFTYPSSDSGFWAMGFTNAAGTPVGTIVTTATATTFNTSSDARMKHALAALTGALAAIQALRPVTFRWKVNDEPDEGFLAHELMTVVPHAVTGEVDAVNEDGTIRPLQVDHGKLVVWLVGAIQEMAQRLEIVEAHVAALPS